MIKLHPGQRKAISEYVKAIPIESSRFGYNFIKFDELRNQVLSMPPWRELLPDIDLMTVIRACTKKYEHCIPKSYIGSFEESPIANIMPDIENDLVIFLESLPRPYCVCFQLPRFPKYGVASIQLANNIEIIDTSATDFPKEFLKNDNALADIPSPSAPEKFERNSAYLRFSVPGYAYGSLSSYSAKQAYSKLKEFISIGTRHEVISGQSLGDVLPPTSLAFLIETPLHALAYNPNNFSGESYRIRLPDDMSKYMRRLRVNEDRLRVRVEGKALAILLDGPPATTSHEKATALPNAFLSVAEFLNIDQNDRNAERIRTAIEWYFDAEVAENQTVSFIQRCIGLEAILGDDDRTRSITDKLSDRYAYLLGKTTSERLELKEHFMRVYGKRSTLVHARRSQLSTNDIGSNFEVRDMLAKVIEKEVFGLLRFLRNNASVIK